MTYIHAPVNVILPRSNGVTVELGNPERVVPIPSGAQGLPGEPGFSPIVSVEPITGGNRVTITDADGDTTFDVMNGAQGEQGEPGEGVPTGGVTGQVLKKRTSTDYDTYWANESGGVTSVNGQTGAVILDADDVGALPDDTFIPTKTSDLTNDSGFITDAGVTSFNGMTGAVAYTAPVQSVNGATGTVVLDAEDVGAMSQWDLLWTNASPSSAFAAQTVSLNLSWYDMVAVVTRYGPSDSESGQWGRAISFLKVGWPASKMVNYRGDEAVSLGHRCATVSTTGISFAIGYENTTQSTTRAIPQEIYGIKGVQ